MIQAMKLNVASAAPRPRGSLCLIITAIAPRRAHRSAASMCDFDTAYIGGRQKMLQ